MQKYFLPRQLHPFAWWGWALALAAAASTTTNPLFLAGIIGVASLVAFARRGGGPWGNAFKLYLMLGAFIVVLRVVFRIIFGGGDGPTILFELPRIPLPEVARGIRLLGPVSLESVLYGLYDGLRLAAMIICIGAANSLANPKKLLANLPGALYELGTVMVVTVSALPQLGDSLQRVMRARKLRTTAVAKTRRQKLRAVETIIIPVLSDALERSMSLAASMDVRGYGRAGQASKADRWATATLALLSFGLLAVWAFRFLAGSPDRSFLGIPLLSTALLLAGLGAAGLALRISGRTAQRTQYRPIKWQAPETVTVAAGLIAVGIVLWLANIGDPTALFPAITPFEWPELTVPLLVVLLAAALPAFLTPPPHLASTP
ncbi:MAG TPA: energy-coupling factor transporter transmembrane protein EcfT [Tessaracoccus flavescens]|uniref:Energy-coupling factor transporter transmembrane protein EcfT n=1 Tax=Tessaracoccus flavescens TaxID=399497 RepID=A0A921ERJ2_9ACTN|nr:energy-coupling factor transporter transmembrane protein EcfT [Tessaracoccus flavescens]